MALGLKSQPCSLQCSLEMIRAIDEKHSLLNVVFLA
jgi:hypothetical protein